MNGLRFPQLPLLVFVLFTLSCSSGDDSEGKLSVTATTTQIGDFARQVGGDRIALTVLLKPNQDAHDFDPEPSQIRALAEADVVLRNGIGLDAFADRALQNSDVRSTVVSTGIELREGTHEDHENGASNGEEGDQDPHVWLSVVNAKIMVENIHEAIAAADSANAAYYAENAARYLGELDQLNARIRAAIETIPSGCRKLVTNHEVLGYYAAAYGLSLVGSVIPSVATDAQPSAADVAEIVRKVRAEGVPAIFAESSANPGLVRQVAREAGVKVVDDLYGDSLGARGSDGETYVKMMESNTGKIVEALKDCRA